MLLLLGYYFEIVENPTFVIPEINSGLG